MYQAGLNYPTPSIITSKNDLSIIFSVENEEVGNN